MKNLFHIIMCVSALLTVSSCDYFSTQDSHPDTKDIVFDEPDLKKIESEITGIRADIKLLFHKISTLKQEVTQVQNVTAAVEEQDTLMNAFILARVDTLAQAIEQVQFTTDKLQKQADESMDVDDVGDKLSLAALAMAIISLILTIFLFCKRIGKGEINKIFKHNLDESTRVNKLQDNVARLDAEQKKISQRIKEVDYQSQIDKTPQPSPPISEPSHSAPTSTPPASNGGRRPPEQPKHKQPRYFGKKYMKNNTDKYFTEILDSDQEVCAFVVEFTSEDQHQGEFSIISLDRIKSKDGWEKVVDCIGCSKADATSFMVLERGICVESNGILEVTKNLKIKLVK